MRYFVFPFTNTYDKKKWGITLNYGGDSSKNSKRYYGVYDTEQEAIEKCEKLNAMLYPQPYVFIER